MIQLDSATDKDLRHAYKDRNYRNTINYTSYGGGYLYGRRIGGASGAPNAKIPTCDCKKFEVFGNNFDGIYTMEGYFNDDFRGGVPTPYWAMYRNISDDYTKRYLIFYQNNNKAGFQIDASSMALLANWKVTDL